MSARYAVSVEVVNLTLTEREALHALIAVLTDPGMYMLRQEFLHGDVCLAVEDGEITFPTAPMRVAAETGVAA